jgi:hypothetical protein
MRDGLSKDAVLALERIGMKDGAVDAAFVNCRM